MPGHRHRHRDGQEGPLIWTDGEDEHAFAEASATPISKRNLRYSQLAPLSMFEEKNTRDNLPAQIDLYAEGEDAYKFLFVAKGGGSANKTFLFQGTPSLLTQDRIMAFLKEKILTLGTAACPPYHLAIVIGGTSAELDMKTVKLASTRYLDGLPTQGSAAGHAFRDLEMEEEVHKLTQSLGVGAQFGGKYFCHDVRVIRLPRHGASLPIGLGVSCSADRQALGKITRDGVFLEELETQPCPLPARGRGRAARRRRRGDRPHRPMAEILATLSPLPDQDPPLADRPDDRRARSRPRQDPRAARRGRADAATISRTTPSTTPARPRPRPATPPAPSAPPRPGAWTLCRPVPGGGRLHGDARQGQPLKQVREACARHGGFYLGSIGGPAARLAQDCIKKVEVLEYPELGMEAIWRIEVEDFPAFIVVDDKGNDFFKELNLG